MDAQKKARTVPKNEIERRGRTMPKQIRAMDAAFASILKAILFSSESASSADNVHKTAATAKTTKRDPPRRPVKISRRPRKKPIKSTEFRGFVYDKNGGSGICEVYV